MKQLTSIAIFLLLVQFLNAQQSDLRWQANSMRQQLSEEGITSNVESKNIGPSVFSGRVSNIAVNPNKPSEFYVAYASGGLWYTNNNGITFSPIFDQEAVMTIGDVAVDWSSRTIYVGTGEVNSSRSSYAGVGVYKSTNNGTSWEHLGLDDTHHIGRIILHPSNGNTFWVAALGHLYTENEERGVFKTTDGGKTWSKTLYIDANSGAVDLIIDDENPNILYAATWERIRKAWNFTESGKGSGIHKSTDGGSTWTKMTNEGSGFPNGDGTGRIGISMVKTNGETALYAVLDNYNRRPKENDKKEEGISKNDFAKMSKATFASLDNDKLKSYLQNNRFPDKYGVDEVKSMVANGKITPIALKEYVEDANSLLFDTPVIGAEVYKSTDDGQSWTKTHEGYLDGLYNSYGYYFGQIRVDPTDADKLYIMGVPILRSDDGGQSWKNINGENVHADHHALWINPNNPEHIINGNDGGINISYDYGENWIKCNMPAVGQFYYINVDNAEPYNVYGGTQDNGVWVGSSNHVENDRWHMRGDYPYDMLLGGDGMQVQIDNRDNNTVYTGFQFGNYFRINKRTGNRTYITPKHELGDNPYRWNWQSPILLSSHHQDIVYMGSNKLLRSMDQGGTFKEISSDLTNGGKKGDVAFGTLSSISESPLRFGLIYTGSDDGQVNVTKDGGVTWTNIGDGLPKDKWVSRIVASHHDENRVYVSLNGYRDDDFEAYLYMSDNMGKSWTNISATIPSEPINVVKEDPNHENFLYVGTDHGTYISVNMGKEFNPISTSIPKVAVHDLVVHARDKDLLIGTHGRSIYKIELENVYELPEIKNEAIHLFSLRDTRVRSNWGKRSRQYSEISTPEYNMDVYSKANGNAELKVMMGDILVKKQSITVKKGLSQVTYDMSVDESNKKKYEKALNKESEKKIQLKASDNNVIYLKPGTYIVQVSMNGTTSEQSLTLK